MKLEIKTTNEIVLDDEKVYTAFNKKFKFTKAAVCVPNFETLDLIEKWDKTKWTSNESLVTRLKEALSKTADSSKIVAVKRMLKELEEK